MAKTFTGDCLVGDLVSKSNRLYPVSHIFAAVEKAKEVVNEGRMLGTIRSPLHTHAYEPIHLRDVSHVVRDLHFDENNVLIATVEFLDTDIGIEAQKLADAKELRLSVRGSGTLLEDTDGNFMVVQPDYKLKGVDFCPKSYKAW